MSSASGLYNTLIRSKKERFEIILEPLQAIIQLAILSFYPIGTKLTIYNNLLFVQPAYWGQSFVRTYYNDSKDDLFYLFNVIVRFNKFYYHIADLEGEERKLFDLLINLAKNGLDNLLQTYTQIQRHALLHTLQMYKNMLNNPDLYETREISSDDTEDDEKNGETIDLRKPDKNIDDIFIQIKNLYNTRDFIVIYNILKMMGDDPSNYDDYMKGFNQIFEPKNALIRKWINDNIVF
tara:strand:+ start:93 stop:800 length:708 start_codon:yes stop_codon:yes gene_type:complete